MQYEHHAFMVRVLFRNQVSGINNQESGISRACLVRLLCEHGTSITHQNIGVPAEYPHRTCALIEVYARVQKMDELLTTEEAAGAGAANG